MKSLLKVVHNPESNMGPSVVVLGMFDGVHVGHQALLCEGRKIADQARVPLCVCTFEPHPLEVLAPERAPARLTLPAERNERMAAMHVDAIGVHDFTWTRATQKPEDFLNELVAVYQPLAIVCGYNFTFGSRGSGNPAMLRLFGEQKGIQIVVIDPVLMEGATVSSTRIRQALTSGDMAEATRLLGVAYQLGGQVLSQKDDLLVVQPDAQKVCPANGTYQGKLICGTEQLPVMMNVDSPKEIQVQLMGKVVENRDGHVALCFEGVCQ